MNNFCNVYKLSNLIKEKTFFKNPDNQSCIDSFLTNHPKCFQGTIKMETAISDFHKLVVKVLKIFYKKEKPKIIHYRNNETFNTNLLQYKLNNELLNIDSAELSEFTCSLINTFKYALIKRKYIPANNSAFKRSNNNSSAKV